VFLALVHKLKKSPNINNDEGLSAALRRRKEIVRTD
jgi:hypothetical protein